jgi:hypothetical protein
VRTGSISFVPPGGRQWCLDRAGNETQQVVRYHPIAGRSSETVGVPERAHSFYIIVGQADVRGKAPRTRAELLDYANKWARGGMIFNDQPNGKQILEVPPILMPGRFTTIGWAATEAKAGPLECVRINASLEERDNQYYPGLQTMLVSDYLCLAPRGEGLVHISVSERFMKGRRGLVRMMDLPETAALLDSIRPE